MNHFFKLVWSRSLGMLVPVPEVSRAVGHRGRRSSARARRRLAKRAMQNAGLGAVAVLAPASAYALPQGGSVAAGTASISTNASTLTVNQTSSKAIINWQSFSVGAGESVNFRQPGTSSVALNRVLGNDPSQIFGRLTANGQIFLINPNGIVFAPGAQVDVGGLLASTLDIANQDFLAGNYQFSGVSTASVVNYGKIKTFNGGYVAFIGNSVDNEGVIKTPGGTTALGAGGSVAITLAGNSLVSFQVTTAALNAAVKNGGAIVAPNGVVLLTAQAKNALLQTVVNNTGLIQANSASSTGGVVTLLGGTSGTVAVSGTINANSTGGTGGTVVVSGVNTAVSGTARISATGAADGGTIAIGGGVHGGAEIPQAVTTSVDSGAVVDASATGSGAGGTVSVWSDVTNPASVTTVSGSILAKGAGSGAGGFVETSGHLLNINAATVDTGGGTWLLDPYNVTIVGSTSNATGTGFINTVGTSYIYVPGATSTILNSAINTALAQNSVTIQTGSGGPASGGNITVNAPVTWSADDAFTLTAAGNIVVNASISSTYASTFNSFARLHFYYGQASAGGTNASYTINAPINLAHYTEFTAQQGLNGTEYHYTAITDLSQINNWSGNYALGASLDETSNTNYSPIGNSFSAFTGNFDGLGNTISNLTIQRSGTSDVGLFGYAANATIRDVGLVNESVTGGNYTGGLLGGGSNVTITNSYVQGAVNGGINGHSFVGGLEGSNHGGTITNSYATGTVSGSGNFVGGLAGDNLGKIINSYATANVTGVSDAGGLAGSNHGGTITDAYATGSVTGSGLYVGGLAGGNNSNATTMSAGVISNVYASGAVSGTSNVGGLLGSNYIGTVTDAYATGHVAGSGNYVGGLAGGNNNNGTITDAYATGHVTGGGDVGGLLGYNSGTITHGYWDTTTTGQASGVGGGSSTGVMGVTTTAALAALPGTVFSSNVWTNAGGKTTPYLIGTEGLGPVSGVVFLASDASATPTPYTVLASQAQLQGISTLGLSGDYVLGADINANGGNFTPIGTYTTVNGNPNPATAFTGVFDGLGHTISNLDIQEFGSSNVGLFGFAYDATIRNIGLVNETVTGGNYTGGLVGRQANNSTITNSFVQGTVNGSSNVGGLVGKNSNGTITDAYATGNVTGSSFDVGGLVGFSFEGTITDTYATGNVSGPGAVGGLVGYNLETTITDAYATGGVTGSRDVGGLVGANDGGTITDAYWDKTTQPRGVGNASSNGVTGLTTAQWLTEGPDKTNNFFANVSAWVEGNPFPVLSALPYIVITGIASQSYGSALGTVSTNSAVNGGNTSGAGLLSGTVSWISSATGTPNAGTTVQLGGSGATAAGYQVTYGGTDTITPAVLTITGLSGSDKIFDGSTSDALIGTPVINGLVNGQTVTLTNDAIGTLASAGVGSEAVTTDITLGSGANGFLASNYTLIQPTLAPVEVAPVAQKTPTVTLTLLPSGKVTVVINLETQASASAFGYVGSTVSSPATFKSLNAAVSFITAIAASSGGGVNLVIITGGGVNEPDGHKHDHVALSSTPAARQEAAAATTHGFD